MTASSSATASASIEQFIAGLPKAELHVHLEGSVDADTLWELACRQRSSLADRGRESLNALFHTTRFPDFLQAFKTVCLHLHTPEDFELITYRALQRMAGQNIRYTEMILSAGVMIWRGQPVEDLFLGARRGAQCAEKDFGIRTRWIFDAVRQFPLEHCWQMARIAAELMDHGVIGIGIGGDEATAPEKFAEVFRFACQRGLHCVAHAGEAAGPVSIWGALQSLGAERIGHGLTAAQDEALLRHLAESGVPVEICLTSNLRTGGITSIELHPLRRYFSAGIAVSLHTDDPTLFGTNLTREYCIAHEVFGFTCDELRVLAANSFRAAFLTAAERQDYLKLLQGI